MLFFICITDSPKCQECHSKSHKWIFNSWFFDKSSHKFQHSKNNLNKTVSEYMNIMQLATYIKNSLQDCVSDDFLL